MTRAAADHVDDLVRTKRLGHTGSDGSAPAQRLNRHGRWFERASECLSHGRRTAVAAVAQMIIDDGVASRAQRRGLLSDRARAVGCAIRVHPRHGAVCCVTLAGGYGPPPLKEARKVTADAANLPDDFEEVLFSVPVVDIHDRVYQALERGGKVVFGLCAWGFEAFRLGRGREGREVRRGLGPGALGGLVHLRKLPKL